ncbi:hypothetical protein EAH_00067350 [Eimeria acervulina]|uniref:Uncharacterized protein n=1 Tax=Eimeria acervulina TaxID=5801 RepID=U6GTS5_EIMAC|nr:hypothetical protein EAH_00067350 [Eimeria acervulina]CDI82693.1 hypothetical protein EAH_00067350 [Eimeria acervulina]
MGIMQRRLNRLEMLLQLQQNALFQQQPHLLWHGLDLLQQQQHQHIQQRERHDGSQQEEQNPWQREVHQQARAREEQQVTLEEKSGQQHDPTTGRRKRKRGQQEGAELLGEPQSQHLKPAESVSAPMVEDAWLTHGPPRLQTPQPSTSQQALQSTAAAVPAGPSTPEGIEIQAIPGFSQPHHPPSHPAAVASASSYDADAPGTSEDGGPAAALYRRNADMPLAASMSAGVSMGVGVEHLGGVLTNNSSASVEASSARAGSIVVASVSIATTTKRRGKAGSPLPSVKEHPFVHLPRLTVEGPPVECSVDVKRAVSTPPGRRFPVPLLQKSLRLFLQPMLNAAQMKELATLTEQLIGHAMFHQRYDVSHVKPHRAAERLGVRFLVLETVVSTLIVLHQTPDPVAWKQLTDAISHAQPLPTPQGHYAGRRRFFTTLAAELSSAIKTLKTGRRPDPADLLDIKLKLFCHKYSPPRLKEADFDIWRQCDRDFTEEP